MTPLTVDFFTELFKTKSNRVLVNTINNSQIRINGIKNAGLTNTASEQTEINRIQAASDLKAARARKDKVAEKAALSRMQAANRKIKAASDKALTAVNKVDKTTANISYAFKSGSRTLMLVGGGLLLFVLTRK